MYNGYLPNEMIDKEFRWEYVNYGLYHQLNELNNDERLHSRVNDLVKMQEAQLVVLQQTSTGNGLRLRNYPEYYSAAKNTSELLKELLKRENELLLEYKSYRSYFLPPNAFQVGQIDELISNKENQLQILTELSQCYKCEKDQYVRQEYFLESGYRLEKITGGLTFPTVITFDDQGNLFLAEAGYAYGAEPGEGRIVQIDANGEIRPFVGGFGGPVTGLTWHDGYFYVAEGAIGQNANGGCGSIIKVSANGSKEVIVTNLRTCGDHFTGDIKVGPDNMIYFTVGSATNSGVVGKDNLSWVERNPQFHDVPARDYVLNGKNFLTDNPLQEDEEVVETGAFKPFGVKSEDGEVIKGNLYANGVLYRCHLDGSNLEVYADGLRNPFGLSFSPFNNKLYVTDNGADDRGSRPINRDWDNFWEISQNGWYGWPDFYSGLPVTTPRFQVEGKPRLSFLMKRHPKLAGQPIVRFEPHTSSNKFSFSTNREFGYTGQVFVGQLGSMAGDSGLKVVRVNLETGQIRDFYRNNRGLDAQSGPIRPVGAIFNPEGNQLNVVDFGLMGPREKSAGTGSLWRIVKE
ncbi:glucose dehydrogenase [Anaerobacillus alkaliphilus]|uniref:Glucose dehydrogenase n=1 Tax=Anaerobacillus alkaliphilus TaxID=1548597 RepID=A0A4Q0VMS6_9BACI|nr:PQQ-dependent sugar dehydrogenase [Anaerobacillus alkaliphilus]RXI96608.1 glucose dehydrogenase [Anaerobacillus alkaliphilus]